MTIEEKKPYEMKATTDRERYKREMSDYSIKTGQPLGMDLHEGRRAVWDNPNRQCCCWQMILMTAVDRMVVVEVVRVEPARSKRLFLS